MPHADNDTAGFEVTPPWHDPPGMRETAGVRRFRNLLEVTQADDLLNGRMLRHYQLLQHLGTGSMGSVYRARNVETEEMVAVKVLDASFVRQHDAVRRFEKEARLLAEASSPFITRLLDVCTDSDWHFIVTELVTGTTLSTLLKQRRRLSERIALNITADVAQALVDISDQHIIHRDIKPENILLGLASSDHSADEFVVKLTDFGLARHTQQTQSMELTRVNTLLGTPLYMSPEQFSDCGTLDARSDVYSLGATLFCMLTGQPPFLSDDTLKLAELHRHAAPPDARSFNPQLSDSVTQIVARCLQKSPDLRYETAAELLADLQCLQRGEATSIKIHPAVPTSAASDCQVFTFEWDLVSSPADLWPYVSNTERLNRAIGLPAVHYTTSVDGNHNVQVFANVRIAGMAMKWREHVFEWIEAQRMGILREFEFGPLKWFTSTVELFPAVDGRTRLVHRFQVEGRGWFGRAFTRLKFGLQTRRSLTRVYRRIDGVLTAGHGSHPNTDAFASTAAVSHRQQKRLDSLFAKIQQQGGDRETVLQIAEYVQSAPAQDVGRIRPLALSETLNLPSDQVVEVVLRGASAGLFELLWDVICPSCRIATQTYDLMKAVRDHEHCDACNLDFFVDLTNGVEAVFRVNSDLRRVDSGKYCIGGPAHSPHVVAQTRLAVGEQIKLALSLSPADYCIRGPQLPHSLSFCVIESAETTRAGRRLDLQLSPQVDRTLTPVPLLSGQQIIAIQNGFDRDIIVRIERTKPRGDVFSAARASSLPLFRELFPSQTLSRSQLAAVTNVTLLRTNVRSRSTAYEISTWPLFRAHLQQLSHLCVQSGGTWIKIVDHGGLMSFLNPADAISAARQLPQMMSDMEPQDDHERDIVSAISTGNVSVSMICGQMDYIGIPVRQLEMLLNAAESGECVISSDVVEQAEIELSAYSVRNSVESDAGPAIAVSFSEAS